jgi:CRP/FNR family cyclic AMP-dependent transcriptional regulator
MSSPALLEANLNHVAGSVSPVGFLGSLSAGAQKALTSLAYAAAYPAGSILFSEQEPPRGVFIVLKGRVKVSMTSAEGKTVILRIARPGDAVGLHAVVVGEAYQSNAETLELSQVSCIRREAFLNFLREYPDAALQVARQLGFDYHTACAQVRALGLLHSAPRKLAGFLLDWVTTGQPSRDATRATLTLTHEEIGQMIGTSRETVTRTLSDFKSHHLALLKGSTLVIQNRAALQHYADV